LRAARATRDMPDLLDLATAAFRRIGGRGGEHGSGGSPEDARHLPDGLHEPVKSGALPVPWASPSSTSPHRRHSFDLVMEGYGCMVKKMHKNSVWRRDLVYPAKDLRIEVRPMTPDDDQREADFFEAQTLEERANRFLGITSRLPPMLIKRLTHVNFAVDFAIVAVDRATDQLAGVARYVCLKDEPGHASVAVAVLKKYQRLGLGRYLLGATFDSAAMRGITTLVAEILAKNKASRTLFSRVGEDAGAEKHFIGTDGDVHIFHFTFPKPAGAGAPSAGAWSAATQDSGRKGNPLRFAVDDSRHPRSLWRHDLVFETGVRIEVRPGDTDDALRVEEFMKVLGKSAPKGSGVLAAAGGAATPPDRAGAVDFTTGFVLVAIDRKTDNVVGIGRFHRGTGFSQMHVATLPKYGEMGVGDFLAAQLLRAASAEVIPKLYSAL